MTLDRGLLEVRERRKRRGLVALKEWQEMHEALARREVVGSKVTVPQGRRATSQMEEWVWRKAAPVDSAGRPRSAWLSPPDPERQSNPPCPAESRVAGRLVGVP